MKLPCLLILALASPLFAVDFPMQYLPDQLPAKATPTWSPWTSEGHTATATLVGKGLHVEARANERFCYVLGTRPEGKPWGSGAEAWAAGPSGFTIEFRVSCTAESADADVFTVGASDGSQNWYVEFTPGKVKSVAKVETVDTTKLDTYRMAVVHGKLQLSSLRRGVIFKDVSGTGGDNISNRILFGTMGGKSNPPVAVKWNLEFLRWNCGDLPGQANTTAIPSR